MVRSINNVAFLHWIQNIFSRKLSLKMILIRVITNRETNKIPTHSWEPFLFHKAYSAYEKFSILCSHIWGIALYWDRRLVQWMWSDVLGLHQIGSLVYTLCINTPITYENSGLSNWKKSGYLGKNNIFFCMWERDSNVWVMYM